MIKNVSKLPPRYKRAAQPRISGVTAPDGTPWVQVHYNGRTAWIPFSEFAGNGNRAGPRSTRRVSC